MEPLSKSLAALRVLRAKTHLDYRSVVQLLKSTPPIPPEEADEALSLAQKGSCDNTHVYHAYLSYYAQRGDHMKVIQTFNSIKNNVQSDVHALVVHQLHKAGDVEGMLSVMEELRAAERFAVTSAEVETLLLHLARTDLARCGEWWQYLRGRGTPRLGAAAYDTLIAAFGRAGRRDGLNVLDDMQLKGVFPTQNTYASLLQMVDNHKDSKTFDRLLRKTRTKEAWNALLAQCARNGNVARCEELRTYAHKYVRSPEPLFTLASYNMLLAAQARLDNAAKFRAVVREMKERGVAPDAVTYEIGVGLFARLGDVKACNEIAREMKANGMEPTTAVYLALMDMFIAQGERAGCEQLFNVTRSKGIASSAVYDKMIKLYGGIGELKKALDIFDLMQQEGVTPTTATYNLIIAAHANQGLAFACKRFFENMKASSLAPNLLTFAGLLKAHVVNREFSSSRHYFEEMQRNTSVQDAFGAILLFCNLKSSMKRPELSFAFG